MLNWILATALSRLFGDGIGADIAGRGTAFLAAEATKAIRRDDQRVTRVRLTPGESYTVIARPPATRRERKLAAEQATLIRSYQSLTRPSRSQIRLAKKLARAQRRLGKTNENSRKYAKRSQAETRLGVEFDRRMRPSKRELKVVDKLDSVTSELDSLRAKQMESAGASRRRRRQRVTIYS
ncbi:MAG TPA: hypothetical protein VL068_10560 [Microthrixaceae bacterium]|nr:hypothetical protein [Microthrixaceae bacterium]